MPQNNYRDAIDIWFDDHADEMKSALADLVAVRSIAAEPDCDMPFGKLCYDALVTAADTLKGLGFSATYYDNAILSADLNGGDATLGILAHVDVVPEGEGWDTDPYVLTEKDGKLYGRGTSDDKGPAIASIFAMAAAREINPNLTKNCRIILGSNEETGMTDLESYTKYEKYPPMLFSPDANYPVTNTEKGRLNPKFACSWPASTVLPRIVSITGGDTTNIIPKLATATVEGLSFTDADAVCRGCSLEFGAEITCRQSPDGVIITAHGTSSHGAMPECGLNAQTLLLTVLCRMPMAECEGFYRLKKLLELIPHGDYLGNAMAINCADELSGVLTVNFGVFYYSLTGMHGDLDLRTPICADSMPLQRLVQSAFGKVGIPVNTDLIIPAHHIPAESPFVQTLLRAYEDYTGNKGECLCMGGQTYVHGIPGSVAFGCTMPGHSSGIHGINEHIDVYELMVSAKMFTQIILDICN